MAIASVNPATGEVLKTFEALSDAQLEEKLARAVSTFATFRKTTFTQRAALMVKAAEILEADKEKFGRVMTLEMGKTFRSAVDEAANAPWLAGIMLSMRNNFWPMSQPRCQAPKVSCAICRSGRFSR